MQEEGFEEEEKSYTGHDATGAVVHMLIVCDVSKTSKLIFITPIPTPCYSKCQVGGCSLILENFIFVSSKDKEPKIFNGHP